MDRERLEDLKETIELGLSEPDGFPRTSTDEAREALGQVFDALEAQEQRIEELEKHNKEMRLALLDDIARESQELGLYEEEERG